MNIFKPKENTILEQGLDDMAKHCEELQRENDELRRDKERLDYLLSDYGAGTRADIDAKMKGE